MRKVNQTIRLSVVIVFACSLALACTALPAAANEVKFSPQVSIGDFQEDAAQTVEPDTLGRYIHEIYKYAIGIVGVVSAVVIMFGGVMWIMAGGNASKIDDAKTWIGAALIGLVLALFSYTILKTVNPDLVRIQSIDIKNIKDKPITCCHPEHGSVSFLRESEGDLVPTCQPQTKMEKDRYGDSEIKQCAPDETCIRANGEGDFKCVEYGCCLEISGQGTGNSCYKSLEKDCQVGSTGKNSYTQFRQKKCEELPACTD